MQITGGNKQSDEGAALFAIRVHLPLAGLVQTRYKNALTLTVEDKSQNKRVAYQEI